MESCYATGILKSQSHRDLWECKFCAISHIHPITAINYTYLTKSKPNESIYFKISSALHNKYNTLFYIGYF